MYSVFVLIFYALTHIGGHYALMAVICLSIRLSRAWP